jgi:hypothetical protein
MVIADTLVDHQASMPVGFSIESTDADHNQGKYAFQFPLGVFTVRREPHDADDGLYLQEHLEGFEEQMQLSGGIDAFVGIKAYLSVPAEGAIKLIATHPELDAPMVLLLDEVERDDDSGTPASITPTRPGPVPSVRSTRRKEDNDGDATEAS